MAWNFPDVPVLDEVFTPVADGPSYKWDGIAWQGSAAGAAAPPAAGVHIGDTPPATPTAGQLWWKSDYGTLMIWYDDGTSAQWIMMNPLLGKAAPPPARWTPANLTVKPLLMWSHHNLIWQYPPPSLTGDSTQPNEGTWVGNTHSSDSCFQSLPAGQPYGVNTERNTLHFGPSYWAWMGCTGTPPSIPAGGTVACMGVGRVVSTAVVNSFASTYQETSLPPLEDGTVLDTAPGQLATSPPASALCFYWNSPEAGYTIYATGNGSTLVPGFRSANAADNIPDTGWHSQFWQLGPVNAYRRDGLDMTVNATSGANNQAPNIAHAEAPSIGGININAGNGIDANFAFYAFWTEAPSLTDLQKLEGWAHWDLGIENLLPAAHPWKNTWPTVEDI